MLTNLPANGSNTTERRRGARRHDEENKRGGKPRGDKQTRTRGRVSARENMAHRGTSNIFKCRF